MSAKEAFQRAFDDLGGADALTAWARENPGDFFRLFSRQLKPELPTLNQMPTVVIVDRGRHEREESQASLEAKKSCLPEPEK